MTVKFDELRRVREKALAAGVGSGDWIRCAQALMDIFPAIYEAAVAMRERERLAELERIYAEADRLGCRLPSGDDPEGYGITLQLRNPQPDDFSSLVHRFLTWPVPADVYPDGEPGKPGRTGTNLLTYDQARQMLVYVLDADKPNLNQGG